VSLVTEALRKARQEAAAREAARRGKPVSIRAARPPRSPLDAPRLLAVAALALGAALAGAGLVWWMQERGAGGAGPVATPPATTASPTLPATSQPLAGTTTPTLGPGTRIGTATPPRELTTAGAGLTQAPPPLETPVPAPGAAGSNAQPGPTSRPESAPALAGAEARERVFVLDADLGRVKLHLDFLVYKPSAPFASINGRQVVPGSVVDGLVVDEIGRDFVRLADGTGTIVLRVR
jgi:hypothetical protein